jgi:hypothetical protein
MMVFAPMPFQVLSIIFDVDWYTWLSNIACDSVAVQVDIPRNPLPLIA